MGKKKAGRLGTPFERICAWNSKPGENRMPAASGPNRIKEHMAERAQNLQDTFLNHVRKQKTPLTIF
jgi:hypothetical protein